jgi:hypothetical protein
MRCVRIGTLKVLTPSAFFHLPPPPPSPPPETFCKTLELQCKIHCSYVKYLLPDRLHRQLTPCSRVLEKPTVSANEETLHLLWTLQIHYRDHWPLSWTRCIQSTPSNPISLRSIRFPAGDWEFFSSPPRPDRLWGPPSLLSNGYQGPFPWG